jgi:exodeoxyribonuclease V beta subunit
VSAVDAAGVPPADERFSVDADLPRGRLAIEASAGTGKTYTLAALATRLVAERDVAASELLIVTFTRAATAELRSRVRDRFAEAAAYLAHADPPATDDDVLAHLARVEPAERRVRAARLARAVSEFDAATVTTIHGFATQVLGTLGSASGADRDAVLVDDEADLTSETCADVLAAAATSGRPAAHLPSFSTLVSATRTALHSPDVLLAPPPGEEAAEPAHRSLAELVGVAMAEMAARRRRAGTMCFDDILAGLRDALGSGTNAAAVEALRARYRVALIDEFQDTDPVQWDIFRTLFGEAGLDALLVLVGDPKQAIYSFRGADIHTYLAAVDRRTGIGRRTLGTNWRSDRRLLEALELLFDGATFGDPSIAFTPVRSAPVHADTAICRHDRPDERLAAVSVRLAVRPGLARTTRGDVDTAAAVSEVVADLAEQVVELLDAAGIPADGGGLRRLRPNDVAVLVKTAEEADLVQRALVACGVPAVLARGGSVLRTTAAQQWRWLLEALLRPSDPRRVRTFALSWFVGWSAEQVEAASDAELAELAERLHRWSASLVEHGAIELVRQVWSESGVVARVLAQPDGDRAITDLDHLGELLAAAPTAGVPSVAGLLAVLEEDPEPDVDAERDTDLAARRVETDAEAVQVMTVWVAKGLEFPVVCVPTMWRKGGTRPVITTDPQTGQRTFDVSAGKGWPDAKAAKARKAASAADDAGEMLRLLYVALTRARHHTIVWWSRTQHAPASPMARLLFARHADGTIDPERWAADKLRSLDDDTALDVLRPVVERSQGAIAAALCPEPRRDRRWTDPLRATDAEELQVATLASPPDRSRSRWSFTSITGHEHRPLDPLDPSDGDAGAADEAAEVEQPPPALAEEGPLPPPASSAAGSAVAPRPDPSSTPLGALPAGAAFGTLVHGVLEAVDFAADDLDAQLAAALDGLLVRTPLDLRPDAPEGGAPVEADGRALLLGGLADVLRTPLGPALADLRLCDLPRPDRLDELGFELPLPGGVDDRAVGRLVGRHLASGDPFAGWAASVADGRFGVDLAGHLTGSIDLVLRHRGPTGAPRFVVVDYKTNRLHPRGEAVVAGDYDRSAMAAAMADHHYPLQALLYAVALHRYLRWRLPGYGPATHLGGAAYLFVRGMVGPAVPRGADGRPDGVLDWAIPPALVVELSDLLDGRPPAEAPRDGRGDGRTGQLSLDLGRSAP